MREEEDCGGHGLVHFMMQDVDDSNEGGVPPIQGEKEVPA